jgi:PAS domain S-box-containing protein
MNGTAFRSASWIRAAAWSEAHRWWPPLAVGGGYYVGCLAGFALRFPSSGISFFWPPTAILTAALILAAPSSWLALLAASFVAHAVAHAQAGVPAAASPILFFGNASQALLAAVVVRRFLRGSPLFANCRTVLVFVIGACVLAPAVASVIPAYVYVRVGWAPNFLLAWRGRAISNGVAMLTLVPSFITLSQLLSERRRIAAARFLEYVLLLLGMVAVQKATSRISGLDILGLSVALYAPAPFLLWATARFGGPGLSFTLVWTTLLMIVSASGGHGSLAGVSAADTVVGMHLLIAANAVPMMLIAGLLEQNRAEHQALLGAELQNRAVLQAVPDSLYVLSRDGASARSLDSPAAPAAPADSVADVLPPELLDKVAQLTSAAEAGNPSVVEFTTVSGLEVRRYEARLVGMDDDRVLSVVRDITARSRAENALRQVQERYALATAAGGIGVWELDLATLRVRVEGNLSELLGYPEQEAVDLSDWIGVIAEEDREDLRTRLESVMTGGSASFETEFRLMRKDGSAMWVASKGAAVHHVNGKPMCVMGTYADITDKKEASRALEEANDALVRTGRIIAVAEFSASIAHELQQPLTAIAANARATLQSLTNRGSAVDVRAALGDVLSDCARASEIVNRTQEMLTKHPPRKTAMNLNDAVRHILQMASGRLRRTGVRVELMLGQGLPPVQADVVQVQQVLLNLVLNAVDAMQDVPHHRRVLRITSRRKRSFAVVSVRDGGEGLDLGAARRVFEPFYTTKPTGTGMGLAISRSIVTNHDGKLFVLDNVDHGVTFRFTLPLAPPQPEGGQAIPATSRRVLIVDDHEELTRALTRLLRAGGHEVAVAHDGAGALAAAEAFQPDAAVVDISMVDMSGLDVGRALRKVFPPARLQMIALTAYGDDDLREACSAAGFDAYLVKPRDIQELQRLLADRP